MGNAVSAADANRDFSKLLGRVREGRRYVITSHGKPVAQIIPMDGADPVRASAKAELLARLRARPASVSIGSWTRDELYED
jgi:prevent-host-death family protein